MRTSEFEPYVTSASDADVPLMRCDDDAVVHATWTGDAKRRHLCHLLEMIARQSAGENYAVRGDFAVYGRQRRVAQRSEGLHYLLTQFMEAAICRQ